MTFNTNNPNIGAETVKNILVSPFTLLEKLVTKLSDKKYNNDYLGNNELSLINDIKHKNIKNALKYISGTPTTILWLINIKKNKVKKDFLFMLNGRLFSPVQYAHDKNLISVVNEFIKFGWKIPDFKLNLCC